MVITVILWIFPIIIIIFSKISNINNISTVTWHIMGGRLIVVKLCNVSCTYAISIFLWSTLIGCYSVNFRLCSHAAHIASLRHHTNLRPIDQTNHRVYHRPIVIESNAPNLAQRIGWAITLVLRTRICWHRPIWGNRNVCAMVRRPHIDRAPRKPVIHASRMVARAAPARPETKSEWRFVHAKKGVRSPSPIYSHLFLCQVSHPERKSPASSADECHAQMVRTNLAANLRHQWSRQKLMQMSNEKIQSVATVIPKCHRWNVRKSPAWQSFNMEEWVILYLNLIDLAKVFKRYFFSFSIFAICTYVQYNHREVHSWDGTQGRAASTTTRASNAHEPNASARQIGSAVAGGTIIVREPSSLIP